MPSSQYHGSLTFSDLALIYMTKFISVSRTLSSGRLKSFKTITCQFITVGHIAPGGFQCIQAWSICDNLTYIVLHQSICPCSLTTYKRFALIQLSLIVERSLAVSTFTLLTGEYFLIYFTLVSEPDIHYEISILRAVTWSVWMQVICNLMRS